MIKIVILGLGYVGLPLAVELSKKYDVVGIDIDESKIKELAAAHDRMGEVSKEMLEKNKVEFSSDLAKVKEGDVIIVAVPTPIDSQNNPDLELLKKASSAVGKNMKEGAIVVFESTVYPGATEEVCAPILEKESGLKLNETFYLGYSPERMNPGDKVHTIDKVVKIVSGSTPAITKQLEEIYGSIVTAGIHTTTSIRAAEAAKVIENVQRDLNIALINELAMIFDKLDLNVHEILEAAGSKWNFHKYTPGLVGGHCIGVDPYYLTYKAQEIGYNPDIILAGRRLNDNMHSHYVQKIIKELNRNGVAAANAKIAVMGLTFKENCSDYRNSRARYLISELKDYDAKIYGIDPWLDDETIKNFGAEPMNIEDFEKTNFDAVIVLIPHSQFQELDYSKTPICIDIKGKTCNS